MEARHGRLAIPDGDGSLQGHVDQNMEFNHFRASGAQGCGNEK